jgi:tRNA dimethylallyltransferase
LIHQTSSSKPKLVAVIGATATGKTAVGIELALQFDGEVVNVDSRLFYRGMDVATAKPRSDETKGVPHHLINILDPDEHFNLGKYLKAVRSVVVDITGRGKLPILVGGSGQYIWAIIEGWEVPEIEPDRELRAELESRLSSDGVESLAQHLNDTAHEVAKVTDLKNPRRVIRAIERVLSDSNDNESNRSKADEPPFDHFIVGLNVERSVLHTRVVGRLASMKESGWVLEVERLLAQGYTDKTRALSGIGYRQMIDHLEGQYDLDEALRLTAVATNRLIRQQSNWFKRDDARINWFDMTYDAPETTKSVVTAVNEWQRYR